MKIILDILPLAAFFISYQLGGLMTATIAIMAATSLSLLILYVMERKLSLNPLISGILVGIFGGLTLFFDNAIFIKMKPTLVNLLFAAILIGGLLFLKKPLLKYMLEIAFQLTEEGWQKLTMRWGIFFILLAAVNEVIWRNFSEEFWVNFKVFGMMPLTMIFMLSQLPLIKRHIINDPNNRANN